MQDINFKLATCLHAEKGGFVVATRVGEGLVELLWSKSNRSADVGFSSEHVDGFEDEVAVLGSQTDIYSALCFVNRAVRPFFLQVTKRSKSWKWRRAPADPELLRQDFYQVGSNEEKDETSRVDR